MSGAGHPFEGVVLAGGQSRRMGVDKALIRWNGLPLWQRQVETLGVAGATPVQIVRRPDQPALSARVPHLTDGWPDAGPLAGIQAALAHARSEWVAILAVDLPEISGSWFRWLRQSCRPGRGAIVQHAGWLEPVAAIYPRSALEVCEAHLARGTYGLQSFAATLAARGALEVLDVAPRHRWRLRNCNRPADLVSAVGGEADLAVT